MGDRFSDAVSIQQGASNPRGVARSLVKALDDAANEGKSQRTDPAARMIVHQLCHLLGIMVHDIQSFRSDAVEHYQGGGFIYEVDYHKCLASLSLEEARSIGKSTERTEALASCARWAERVAEYEATRPVTA
jgi:hypothetical protein